MLTILSMRPEHHRTRGSRFLLTAIREFFDRHLASRPQEAQAVVEHRARLAAAALLIEVTRSDEHITAAEREAVLGSLQRRFDLDPREAQQLFELAETQSQDAHDFYQFTSKINGSFPPEQKARLIEELWRAAYADAALHRHEEHLIRRVANLLHLPHSTFIATKLRALETLDGVAGPRR